MRNISSTRPKEKSVKNSENKYKQGGDLSVPGKTRQGRKFTTKAQRNTPVVERKTRFPDRKKALGERRGRLQFEKKKT